MRKGQYPHLWKIGPDPVRHDQYLKFIQQRNQARWRGEEWALTFEQWCEIWGDLWSERGRCRDDYCMSRRDWSQPWDENNAVVITRRDHARNQGQARSAGICLAADRRNQNAV